VTDESIFAAAIAIPSPDQRSAYLDRACAGNPALRREVEELLGAHAANNPLDSPLRDVSATGAFTPAKDEAGPAVGDRIGPYKLLERIGEGGMGEVWVAEQLAPLQRRVAVKLIKPGMDSRSVLGRFEAERQALAVMDHPNIAKVLDAGTTPNGRPYFVMELVKGTPITDFCDARKLTPNQRLELFIPVCQAIQHAHMKGIIHRDIKPSNVLVALHDETPVPKVIDFGVAKAIGPQLTEKTIYTGFGALIGTPAYMAPEQATFNQIDVDTRADVYALGVLLYELLAGSPPVELERLKKAALDEVLRIVRDEEPQRPSQRMSTSLAKASIAATRQSDPVKLSRLMRSELDWIVMKALEKDRARRYDTANGLAKDIQRYLAGDAIEARPPSALYRFRKMARRNRAVLTTAALVSMALLLGTAASVWQAVRATRAQAEARVEEARAVAESARADEEAAIAKSLNNFTRDKILGECIAASEELSRILSEIVDEPTAKTKRAEFVASVRRFRRANDTLRSLAEKTHSLPPRPLDPQDLAFIQATVKAQLDAAQKIQKLALVGQKFPTEMSGIIFEALKEEPKKK
jgi:serine/threonine protein kinase